MVTVRPYRSSDAQAVSHVVRTTMGISNRADYPPDQLQPLIDYFSPAKVDQLSRERICLVAEVGNQVVGTGALAGCELATFFVLPGYQGRGIGTALLKAVEAHAKARGTETITVHASLTGAGFYERHGYQRTGVRVEGAAGPQITMRKALAGTP